MFYTNNIYIMGAKVFHGVSGKLGILSVFGEVIHLVLKSIRLSYFNMLLKVPMSTMNAKKFKQ